ncbi:hypothetical protein D1Q00_gp009 [Trichoplusia ni granulovirus LBIV-12]|jgi:hypothetical protein|uniref:Uncharacterized protein n=2 Tax=Betabaculovirus TaxID=558017 RepID=A0A1D8QL49_GVTN|nr:hypothetical protein PsunGV_gp009 [Pseudalatia unipuncta granulovirus]YP_009506079.1 hypothetical protein D1Q00_gp009 [Trichoplusia ni granulovirus LBIV-12]ACH69359.1 unknown [Pseudalatia unipuncta granulovirus]AOW41348.1 hypothetical protein [Trichoplusia ni granulovirus LBIV-12]
MIRLGKANSQDADILTFQIAHGYDSCLQFKYAMKNDTTNVVGQSKTVSGIDASRPLSFNLNPMISVPIKNSYIISVFRLPHLYTQLVNSLPSVTVVKVFSKYDPPEIWYVVGVRKNFETLKSLRLKSVITTQGDKYEKEVYMVSGNLPREFVSALRSNQVKNVNFLHSLSITLPRVLVNNGPVRVEQSTSAVGRL